MKKFFYLLFLISLSLNAQQTPPKLISYKAIAMSNSGNIIVNKNIAINAIVLQNTNEKHVLKTGSNDSYGIKIGRGKTPSKSIFDKIDWTKSDAYLSVGISHKKGNNYDVKVGKTQLSFGRIDIEI